MKRIIIVIMFLVNASFINAQTFEEWFRQKETQVEYLVEQIGALKAYGEVINKGYDIAHNGLTNVFNSKERDYQQHSNYFLSLWKVKSGVKSYSKASGILSMKAEIEKQYGAVKSFATEFLHDEERGYINSVYANLVTGANDLANELQLIIRDDQLQLKDDERIRRIDTIYFQMQDRYGFSQSFANEIKQLIISRLKEGKDLGKLNSLYGIR